MATSSKQKLAYNTNYESSPAQVKKREERNKARYDAEKAGKVHKGDGLEVDHKTPLGAGGSNAPSNQRVISESRNKGWRAGDSGSGKAGYKVKKV